jgi:hypothetical protein
MNGKTIRIAFFASLIICPGVLTMAALPEHTPFVSVVLKDFDSWDTDHDGVLSVAEINRAVTDPSVKGDAAAAAAALKLLSHSKKTKLPPLTKDFFADYDRTKLAEMQHRRPVPPVDAVTATVDTVASASTTQPAAADRLPDFDLYFTAGKDRIAKGGPVAFPGRFVLDHARQGPLGDCFFVSSVNSLAFHDPERFAKMIVPQKDGSYVVNLPAAKPIAVPAPTDAELAISSTTAGDGVWMAIMEQAFGKYRAITKGGDGDIDGTDVIRTGGDSLPTIEALTGHKAIRISFGKTVEFRKANADKVLPHVREELKRALADHRVITAGVLSHKMTPETTGPDAGTPTPVPPNISTNHVYAILNFDPATDTLEIWNPHGQHFEPKGPPGLTHGYPTDHGRFKLPLTEAYQFYSSFTFETDAPKTSDG